MNNQLFGELKLCQKNEGNARKVVKNAD